MMNHQMTDTMLVSLYQDGHEKAFTELFKRYKSKVYNTIYLIVKDSAVAEDLLQDVFIKSISILKTGKYTDEGKFLPWINRIARNLAIDYFRREKKYPTISDEEFGLSNKLILADPPIESRHIKKEIRQTIRKIIRTLPREQKEIVWMRHYMEMSFQEIATYKDISINTALGRMRYALINLRKYMEKKKLNFQQLSA